VSKAANTDSGPVASDARFAARIGRHRLRSASCVRRRAAAACLLTGRTIGRVVLSAGLFLAVGAASAQNGAAPLPFLIGYVHLENDPRQNLRSVYYQIPVTPLGRAVFGAEVAILDSELIGREIGVAFGLEIARNDNIGALALIVQRWADQGIHFVVADLPEGPLLALADAVSSLPVTIFNVSAADDILRGEECRANLIHVAPSRRMLTDAVVQFLIERRWTDILVLRGPLPEDGATVDALVQSADIFGARITAVRDFAADARNATAANIALLTAGPHHDVVFVADATGEYAATVPYRTNDARPVVGSAGLVPLAWHWAWERSGAPQLNARFEFLAERRTGSADWAAWASVRAVVHAVLRSGSVEYQDVLAFLTSDRMNLDGAKGMPMSVRPWDNQMRQPILLATNNNVVDRAPLEGFVDPGNDLDTLGVPRSQTECHF
jgi:ABC transporter substrate binding protein (PQQ-dependent alcohol dehydrogenase system)